MYAFSDIPKEIKQLIIEHADLYVHAVLGNWYRDLETDWTVQYRDCLDISYFSCKYDTVNLVKTATRKGYINLLTKLWQDVWAKTCIELHSAKEALDYNQINVLMWLHKQFPDGKIHVTNSNVARYIVENNIVMIRYVAEYHPKKIISGIRELQYYENEYLSKLQDVDAYLSAREHIDNKYYGYDYEIRYADRRVVYYFLKQKKFSIVDKLITQLQHIDGIKFIWYDNKISYDPYYNAEIWDNILSDPDILQYSIAKGNIFLEFCLFCESHVKWDYQISQILYQGCKTNSISLDSAIPFIYIAAKKGLVMTLSAMCNFPYKHNVNYINILISGLSQSGRIAPIVYALSMDTIIKYRMLFLNNAASAGNEDVIKFILMCDITQSEIKKVIEECANLKSVALLETYLVE